MNGLKEFLAVADGWSDADFESWFAIGTSSLASAKATSEAITSFPPLSFDRMSDEVDQVLAALRRVGPSAKLRARQGLGRLIAALPRGISPRQVELLLRLAASLRPVGVAPAVRVLLRRPEVLEQPDPWRAVVVAAFVALADCPFDAASGALFREIKQTRLWVPAVVPLYLRSRLVSDPSTWAEAAKEVADQLAEAGSGDGKALDPLLEPFAKHVSATDIGASLPDLIMYEDPSRIGKFLFLHNPPIFRIVPAKDETRFTVVDRRGVTATIRIASATQNAGEQKRLFRFLFRHRWIQDLAEGEQTLSNVINLPTKSALAR